MKREGPQGSQQGGAWGSALAEVHWRSSALARRGETRSQSRRKGTRLSVRGSSAAPRPGGQGLCSEPRVLRAWWNEGCHSFRLAPYLLLKRNSLSCGLRALLCASESFTLITLQAVDRKYPSFCRWETESGRLNNLLWYIQPEETELGLEH